MDDYDYYLSDPLDEYLIATDGSAPAVSTAVGSETHQIDLNLEEQKQIAYLNSIAEMNQHIEGPFTARRYNKGFSLSAQ